MERKPLTVARFRELAKKVSLMERPTRQRELTLQDLQAIGCSGAESAQILELLDQKELLDWYLRIGREAHCVPVTRISDRYPHRLRQTLGLEAPGTLWYQGDISLLEKPKVSLVGSRDLEDLHLSFAREVGRQCALQGYVLVSGHARGADKEAEDACLENGGQVISVVCDSLQAHSPTENVLFLSEDGYNLPFTPYRALSRNRIIHALGEKTFVARCANQKGGTWDGTCKNLRHNWSPVFCCKDGSPAGLELENLGAIPVDETALQDFSGLQPACISFLL